MRKLAIAISAIALAIGSTSAFACCSGQDVTHNYDTARASAAGFAGNVAISKSFSAGNGYAQNTATSGSGVNMYGYGVDRSIYGSNGYQSGVHVSTDTYATASSLNYGNATGLALAGAVAGAKGSASGYADSHTHDFWCRYEGRTYFGDRKSEAMAFGGGKVKAGSASLAITGGPNTRTYAENYSGASAGIDLWGHADTDGDHFWAGHNDTKYADSYSDSVRLGSGPAINGGIAGSKAIGGGIAWGRGGDLYND